MRLDTSGSTLPQQVIEFLAPISRIDVPLRQGMTSQVFFVESWRGAVAIKHATGKHIATLRHEHTVLLSLQSLPLPLPIPLLFIEFPNAGWLVMSRLPGIPVLDLLRTEGNQEWRNALIHNLALSIAHLHHTSAPQALMSSGESWLEQMLAQAKHNLETGLGEGTKEDLDYLQRAKPATVMPTLIHGDLFLDNVLAKDGQITGFIDWAFGAIGDYRYDLTLALYDLSADERHTFIDTYGKRARFSPEEFTYFAKLGTFF
jgi:aminoglycoside phosphotransferase